MKPLDKTYCPGCGKRLIKAAFHCHECGYENNVEGYMLSLRELMQYDNGELLMNEVCPAFLRALAAEAIAEGKL